MYTVAVDGRTVAADSLDVVTHHLADAVTSLLADDHAMAADAARVNAAVTSGEVRDTLRRSGVWEATLRGSGQPVTVRVTITT